MSIIIGSSPVLHRIVGSFSALLEPWMLGVLRSDNRMAGQIQLNNPGSRAMTWCSFSESHPHEMHVNGLCLRRLYALFHYHHTVSSLEYTLVSDMLRPDQITTAHSHRLFIFPWNIAVAICTSKIEGMNTASQLPFVLQCSIVPVFSNNVCCDWHNFRLVLDCSYALSLPNGSHENACIFWHGRSGIRVTRIWLRMLILVKARS